jgi:Domain of unknown function (DUF4340)
VKVSPRLRQFVNVNIALVVLALGVTIAVIITSGRVTTSEEQARSFNVLQAFRQDDITRIEIDHGPTRVVLVRTPLDDAGTRGWHMIEPVKAEADGYSVDKVLGALEFAGVVRRIQPSEVNRNAFGLDRPSLVVKLDMGTIHYVLGIGKTTASPPGAAYASLSGRGVPGPGVIVVARGLVQQLSVSADELRGRDMTPYLSPEIARITLKGAGGTRILRHVAGNDWRFAGMLNDVRLSRQAFDRVLVQLARIQADHFMTLKAAQPALDAGPNVEITMAPEDAKQPKGVLAVGGQCPTSKSDVVAIRRSPNPVAACVPSSVMADLETPAQDLVDHGLFTVHEDEVESLRIDSGGQKLSLDRKGSGFLMRAPRRSDVTLDAGNQRLDQILSARGHIVQDPNPKKLGLDPPRGHVTISSAAADEAHVVTETVLVSAPTPDGNVYALRKADGTVLLLPRDAARALTADASLVRSHQILSFVADDFRSLDIRLGAVHERLVRAGADTYVLKAPKGFSVDPGLATDLVDALGTLKADRWVADHDDGSFGLQKPTLSFDVTYAKGDAAARTNRVTVGALASGGAYASLAGDPGVFVLPRDALDALDTLLFDRSVFMLHPKAAGRITLKAKGRTTVLSREGHEWLDQGASLSRGRIQQIIDALSTLRAEAAAHQGPAQPSEGLQSPALSVAVQATGDAGAQKQRWSIGAGDAWRGMSIYYARADGVDATYVIARSKVQQILDAL